MIRPRAAPKYVVSARGVASHAGYSYCQPALYVLRHRKDGLKTYRLVRNLGRETRSIAAAQAAAQVYARKLHVAYRPHVRQGSIGDTP